MTGVQTCALPILITDLRGILDEALTRIKTDVFGPAGEQPDAPAQEQPHAAANEQPHDEQPDAPAGDGS